MIRIRKRKNPITYDVAEVPVLSTKRPMLNAQTDLYRSNEKLRSLMNEEKYEQAKKLFIELVKSNRFHFQHLWKIGVEIIGKTSPKDLTGYLKAVFISSPVKHSAETFNVYIDYLIAENSWELALDEIQPRYDTPIFHHPILLRKMAICCYNLWKSARNNLPEEYLEDGERNENDLRIIRYEKHLRFAARYLSEAHKTYSGDPELLLIYYDVGLEISTRKLTNCCHSI
ncbi:uncharacterized protein EV154DRAFT_40031 [Mucor mucedo]|uniref:uncharacterized protein n=1 Tax=Mucor mucedo TaxID=29922 RepID=UPI00221E5F26|nr:uncharacterized protein EV154DRAFT_40031 [Mucor mucedo]KAI7882122.1 hypothetical protein EV154DRAFT_40031 [Mucor mucedo]